MILWYGQMTPEILHTIKKKHLEKKQQQKNYHHSETQRWLHNAEGILFFMRWS